MSLVDELRKLHELHRVGALSDAEFSQAKAKILDAAPETEIDALNEPREHAAVDDEVVQLRRQVAAADIDRAWEREKERYTVMGRDWGRRKASYAMGVLCIVMGCGMGIFAIGLAMSKPGNAVNQEGAAMFVPFGGVCILFGVAFGGFECYQANAYDAAYVRYKSRRRAVLEGRSDPESPDVTAGRQSVGS